MNDSAPWTIGRLLEWTTDYLRSHDADSPRLDAEVLLSAARGCERIDLYTAFEEVPEEAILSKMRRFVKQRASGVPVAYLVGQREFYSLPFQVTSAVLIPRPETEYLVISLLDRVRDDPIESRVTDIVDVGTGSGILAVCAAKYVTHSRVTAIDISSEALDVARANAKRHTLADKIQFIEGDLLDPLPAEPAFDFVISNPPYVSIAEMASLSPEVREHEPHLALVSGETGTDAIAKLIPQAAERLRGGGWLMIELSPMIHETVLGLFSQNGQFESISTVKDLAGLERIVCARRQDRG